MRMRTGVGLALLLAFLAALGLASSPHFHELLHGARAHECAITLIAAGNVDHAVPAPVLPAPISAPEVSFLLLHDSGLIRIAVPSSILEHAPPALI